MSDVTIHWVSPLPPAETDIAHYTHRILPDLVERADVVLWTDAQEWEPALERYAAVRRFDAHAAEPMSRAGLPGSDNPVQAVFHNIGNSWVFHSQILALARSVPGHVVMHDLNLHEFFRDIVLNGLFSRSAYMAEMVAHYGEVARSVARLVSETGALPSEILQAYPMFESALIGAVGALSHTPTGFEAVQLCALPSYRLELPFAVAPDWSAARAGSGPLRFVQFGYIGPNRRLESVLEALGRIAGEVDFVFDLFGKVWDVPLIEARIAELGLRRQVRLRGFAPEAELDAALREAHLVFNLRYPTMGEASGSQLRIWNAGACSAVSDTGWYATLPDATVCRVSVDGEIDELATLIRRLNQDRAMCGQIGAEGRARLEAAHGTGSYADGIVAVARQSARDARDAMLLRAASDALHCAPGRSGFDALRRQAISSAL